MRRLSFDQYEFDYPDSEQSLELAISSPSRQHANLAAFLEVCGSLRRAGESLPPGWARWNVVAEHLRRFAGLELPHPSKWREAVLLCDEWDELEVGIAFDAILLWYHWSTTA
jgi:hypothetical protein